MWWHRSGWRWLLSCSCTVAHEGVREGKGWPLAGTFVGREVGTIGGKVRGAADSDDDLLECVAKVAREERVDHRIDGRVAVAQPEQHGEDNVRCAAGAERTQEVHGEEGQPAHDKSSDDNGQCLGGLCLHAKAFRLQLCIPLGRALLRLGLG